MLWLPQWWTSIKGLQEKGKVFLLQERSSSLEPVCSQIWQANELSAAVVEQMGEVTLDTNREVNTTQMLAADEIVLLQTATCVV